MNLLKSLRQKTYPELNRGPPKHEQEHVPEPEQHSDRKHLLGQDPEHSPDLEQAADKNSLPEHETISLTEHEQEPVHEAESVEELQEPDHESEYGSKPELSVGPNEKTEPGAEMIETKVTIDAIDEMPEIFAETFCDDGGNREMDTVCYPKFSSFLADARQDSFCPVN